MGLKWIRVGWGGGLENGGVGGGVGGSRGDFRSEVINQFFWTSKKIKKYF